jgi:hypothetical protein
LAAQPLVLDRLVKVTFFAVMATSFRWNAPPWRGKTIVHRLTEKRKARNNSNVVLTRRRDELHKTKSASSQPKDRMTFGRAWFGLTSRRCVVA